MKIYKTKNGQPYIKDKNGRAKFISKNRLSSIKSKSKRTASKTVRRSNTTMARKKRVSRKRSASITPTKAAIGGAVYGLVREPLNNTIKGLTGNLAINLSDEIVLGVASWLIAKKTKGIVRDAAIIGVGIEAHNLSRGGLGGILGNTTTTSTNNTF